MRLLDCNVRLRPVARAGRAESAYRLVMLGEKVTIMATVIQGSARDTARRPARHRALAWGGGLRGGEPGVEFGRPSDPCAGGRGQGRGRRDGRRAFRP